jgi:hypothetical protein
MSGVNNNKIPERLAELPLTEFRSVMQNEEKHLLRFWGFFALASCGSE